MAGVHMTTSMLDDLLNQHIPEDLYLAYQHGDAFKDKKKANPTLRQQVSGFANSAGGVLVCGIDAATWTVTGCCAPGGGSLNEWAARCLTQMAAYVSPVPCCYTLQHPQGDVLIVVTARSPGLVPVLEASGLEYFFRVRDQTLPNS